MSEGSEPFITDSAARNNLRDLAAGEITPDEARADVLRRSAERGSPRHDELLGACELGATPEELQALLGDRLPVFHDWMRGQTMALCPEHGAVVYQYDLARFLAGSRIFD